jgi:anti-sigma B factor antagonist
MHWTEITQRRVGDVTVLDLKGQMTLSGDEEARLLRTVRQLESDGQRRVLLNLAEVSFIDSTGIGEIVGAYTRVARRGGTLKLCGVSGRTQELLDATNIGTVIESFATEREALECFEDEIIE